MEIVNSKAINTLLVSTLDKYLIRQNMTGCFKLKKKEKIQAIVNHVNLQTFQNASSNIENVADSFEDTSDNSDSDDEMDEVLHKRYSVYFKFNISFLNYPKFVDC